MLKVLIVEDEEVIRKGLVYTINWIEMGCDVVGSARDGVEGLQMIKNHSPDIVMTDIKMPRMSGLEMVDEASKENFFKTILLTSHSRFDYAKHAISLQVSDYLLKPVDERILRDIIARIRKEIDAHHCYSKIVEMTKESPLSELERWDIRRSQNAPPNVYVQKAVEKIAEHYHDKISIDSIAEEVGVSSSYLSRKFKESFGKTYLDILNQYRVQQSIRLLNKGIYRINEVSCMCGFNEYKHFCGVFKKYTDMSPSQFMKSGGGEVMRNPDDN